MFSVSIKSNEKLEDTVVKTGGTVNKYIKNNLNKKTLIINDENNINITSGKMKEIKNEDKIIAEITFKHEFVIDKDKIENKEKLDEFIFYIKRCLSNLSSIEEGLYRPIQFMKGTD
jgi:hypothetical protein